MPLQKFIDSTTDWLSMSVEAGNSDFVHNVMADATPLRLPLAFV